VLEHFFEFALFDPVPIIPIFDLNHVLVLHGGLYLSHLKHFMAPLAIPCSYDLDNVTFLEAIGQLAENFLL
jgi:hypothetical protein